MDSTTIITIISSIVLFLIIWLLMAKFHLDNLRSRLESNWKLIATSLYKRYDLIPNLVETVRKYTDKQEVMMERVITVRKNAIKQKDINSQKIEIEHDLTRMINRIVDLGRTFKDLSMDTNFLELRKEINDLGKNIEEKSLQYNSMVREYNKSQKGIFLVIWAKLFKHYPVNIFEIEV